MIVKNCLTCDHTEVDYENGTLRCKESHIGVVDPSACCAFWYHTSEPKVKKEMD